MLTYFKIIFNFPKIKIKKTCDKNKLLTYDATGIAFL